MKIKGIDVSRYQGIINWTKVKASDISFAILKAGGSDAGFYTDSKFEQNYANAKAAGMPVGAYYFVGSGCVSHADGVADAKRFIEILKGKQFEYPVYIDVESTAPSDRQGATKAVIGFCETMEAAGYYCGIYASDISGFVDRLDQSQLKSYDKWVARYGSAPQRTESYGMWQYSESGTVPGIPDTVDMNYCYIDYPTIMKEKGLNGYGTPVQPPIKTEVTDTVKIKILIEGDSGTAVKKMQMLLIGSGYDCGAACADGKFGQATAKALEKFQNDNHLNADKICGAQTWAALLN